MTEANTRLGFTGTQEGMTKAQKKRVASLVRRIFRMVDPSFRITAEHGDCVGADADFHQIIRDYDSRLIIVGHLPDNDSKRAFCECDEYRVPAPYMVRNLAIVKSTQVLIATPKEYEEQQRSGTWSTIRRARALGRAHYIVYPDGTCKAVATQTRPSSIFKTKD